jgi:hypothetical protein
MSFLEDTKAQWNKLPTAGKVAVGGGLVVILLVMVYKHQSGGTTTSASGLTSGGLPATSSTPQAPAGAFPGVQSGNSSVPFLPSGINPLYDQQGGLVAFQQAAAGNPGGSVSPPPTPAVSPFSGFFGLLGANAKVNLKNNTYLDSTGKSVPIPIASGDKLIQGTSNRVWYTDTAGQHLLTSGIGPAIDPRTNQPFVGGGGGESLPSYARSLTHYQIQYGDNLHTVANQLGIKGGLPAWLEHNDNPYAFYHGMSLKVPQ